MASEVASRTGDSEGEAEGDVDDVPQPLDDTPPLQEDAAPHPARRPMNAFLIFCKRHRAQVREKYPHLENRQVTKILGEWWADLPAHQKTSYTDLARQYKEAFLRANPDFKWYKIPAQPPRPPPARPSNQKVPRCDPLPTDGAITFGKLADEAQMGGLSTLLSTASTSSSNNSGPSSLGAFNPVYISTASTSAAYVSTAVSLPSVTSLTTVACVSNSVTLSSMSTNSSSGANLVLWSDSLRRPGSVVTTNNSTTSTTSSFPRAPITTSSTDSIALSVTTIPVNITPPLTESGNTMTPPKPPKKRYLHENLLVAQNSPVTPPTRITPDTEKKKACSALLELSQTSVTEEKFKSSQNWTFGHQKLKNEAGIQGAGQTPNNECVPRTSNSPVTVSSTLSNFSPPVSSPQLSLNTSQLRVTTSHPRNSSTDKSQTVACDEQPLNLTTTETIVRASKQQLINNIVDKYFNGPNVSGPRTEGSTKFSFFRPENLNNNNNDMEKHGIRKVIDSRLNGICDVQLLVSKTIDYVIDRALDGDSKITRKEKILSEGYKRLFTEGSKSPISNSVKADLGKEVLTAKEEDKKHIVTGSNGEANGINNSISRPRKRMKGDGVEENEVMKKKKDMNSSRTSQGKPGSGLGMVGGRRSRAPRKCKGKRYEELISEGVLQTSRRSRTRNSRWEDEESGRIGENEENVDDPQQQDNEDEEDNDDESLIEEEASRTKASEEENGEAVRCRAEDGRRRGQRQMRRLRPDDFDLEARIEALPSLSLDEFTRRKKERKRTSSASSTAATANQPGNTTTTTSPSAIQPTLSAVSSSSRVAVQADSTPDFTAAVSVPSTSVISLNTRISGGSVSSVNGTGQSDSETSSPMLSSSLISSSLSPIFVHGGSLSPGEGGVSASDGGPLIGSQKRKARKQTITRHDPVNAPLRRDTSVVEQSVLDSMGLSALAEVALSQPSMKI